jgi:DNA mismatch repair protein MutS
MKEDDTAVKGVMKLYQESYKNANEKYGNKIVVLMQVGKFYEMYDILDTQSGICSTNIRDVTSMLELCMSETAVKGSPHLLRLFAGVPELSIRKYERMINRHGYRGIIISQKKDGKTFKRELDHIVSNGTFFATGDEDVISHQVDKWLWCFFIDFCDSLYYIQSAAIHCSTGKVITSNMITCSELIECDELYSSLSSFDPAEVIVYCTDEAREKLTTTEEAMREQLNLASSVQLLVREYKYQSGAVHKEEDLLVRCFSMDKSMLLASLGFDRNPDGRRVLSLLLAFVEEHNPALINHLELPTSLELGSKVHLGNHTLEQLGMINKDRERHNECYYHFFNKCITATGRLALRSRLLLPIHDLTELQRRIDLVDKWRNVKRTSTTSIRELMGLLHKVYDIERLYRRLQLGHITFNEVWRLITSFSAILEISKIVTELNIPCRKEAITQLVDSIGERWDLTKMGLIQEAVTKEQNGFGTGIHPWLAPDQDIFSSKWAVIRQRYNNVLKTVNTVVADGFKDEPFVFTSTKTRCSKVMKELIGYKTEDVRGTFYLHSTEIDSIEADHSALNNSWQKSYSIFWQEEIAILKNICDKHISIVIEELASIDVNMNLACRAEEYGYCNPTYVADKSTSGVVAKGLRHGILERIRTDISYVPHDLALGSLASGSDAGICTSTNGVLLFGVNSSGKSSLMKSIGLSILLAQTGCPVPASEFKLAPYKSIFTRILGNDNLWAGMSSFVVEMTEFRNILQHADAGSLVLGDELCSGTETASAAALVASGLETLVEKGSSFFFATHLHELNSFPELINKPELKWLHLRVRFDHSTGKLIYDRHLQEGAGSMMYGLEVCRALRLPNSFLEKAMAFRRRLEGIAEGGALSAPGSSYNPTIVRRSCEVCKQPGSVDLEVHHIVHQEDANEKGFVQHGVHKNRASNLVVLCDKCHTSHHKGGLKINGWQDTSDGRELQFEVTKQLKQPLSARQQKQKQKQKQTL